MIEMNKRFLLQAAVAVLALAAIAGCGEKEAPKPRAQARPPGPALLFCRIPPARHLPQL